MTAALSAACSSQKTPDLNKAEIASTNCPSDGDCTVELLKDKTLSVLRDDIGSTYYQILDNKGTNVIRYQYKRHTDPTLADAGYREEVIFEMNASEPEISVSGIELQTTKALFGRFCFCRGQTGYYPINDGALSIKKQKNDYLLTMNFTITEVPQIIKSISIVLK